MKIDWQRLFIITSKLNDDDQTYVLKCIEHYDRAAMRAKQNSDAVLVKANSLYARMREMLVQWRKQRQRFTERFLLTAALFKQLKQEAMALANSYRPEQRQCDSVSNLINRLSQECYAVLHGELKSLDAQSSSYNNKQLTSDQDNESQPCDQSDKENAL